VNFGRRKIGLDRENLVEDWDGENYLKNVAWKNCYGGDFSNRDCTFVSTDYVAAVSRPHSCVLEVLAESEKHDTLQKHGSVPDSMNNPDCELVVG